ncbi:MAG: hypothetical protein ABIZ04_03060 [Opitutus sp.]
MTTTTHSELQVRQWRQIGTITVAAISIFALLRWLPTGTSLSHMDFRVDAKNSIEFCDPLNPQFIPVVAVASPVAMKVTAASARAGAPVEATVTLKTASGKPIETQDLLVVHTRRLHLLIADPTLTDYQHVHPEPTKEQGTWSFRFTPKASGAYRIFADFTPAATNRGLYANADLRVEPAPVSAVVPALAPTKSDEGYTFALTPASLPLRAKQTVDLTFTITRSDGALVPLEPVMDAYAHLVAFDQARSGFAHLHPMQADLSKAPDRTRPTLNFKITIPAAGRYVIWAQVNLAGHETFVPFWFDVEA